MLKKRPSIIHSQCKNVPNACHNPNPYIPTPQKCHPSQNSDFPDVYTTLADVRIHPDESQLKYQLIGLRYPQAPIQANS